MSSNIPEAIRKTQESTMKCLLATSLLETIVEFGHVCEIQKEDYANEFRTLETMAVELDAIKRDLKLAKEMFESELAASTARDS